MFLIYLAKTLQLAGMIGVGYGFYIGVAMEGALTDELLHLAIGFGVFSVGTAILKRCEG